MKTLLTGLLGLMFLAGGVAAAEDRGRDRDRSAIDSEVIRTRLVTRECGRCEGRRRDSDGWAYSASRRGCTPSTGAATPFAPGARPTSTSITAWDGGSASAGIES